MIHVTDIAREHLERLQARASLDRPLLLIASETAKVLGAVVLDASGERGREQLVLRPAAGRRCREGDADE